MTIDLTLFNFIFNLNFIFMKRFTLFLALVAFIGLANLDAQTREISGMVTSSSDGQAIPGVSVVVKGTTIGTTTNVDGSYTLSVPQDASALIFSFVGMQTKEVSVGGQEVINVQLQPQLLDLDEVVITAYGISRAKKAVAYQTEEVSGEDLMNAQGSSAAQGLIGKVAGLQVNVQSSGVKSENQILLRGLRSISGNNEALIVIDGAIASQGAFNDLNPNDIENVNVLKGATAAALYGSDAANGALIVTTKGGKRNQRFTAGFTNTTTFEQIAYMPDFQTTHGIGWDGEYNNIENTNWGPRFDGQLRQIGPTFRDGTYQAVPFAPVEDNLKNFFNTGRTIQNTAYFSGGDENSSFYMSAGNVNTSGVVPDDVYERYTFTANAEQKIGKLTLGLNSSFSLDDKDVVGDEIGDQDRAFYWFVLNTPANIPLTDYSDWDNPESFGYADNYFNAFYQNPYWAIGTNRNMDETKRLRGNVYANWDILSNVMLTGRLGINRLTGIGKEWRARQTYDEVLQPYHTTVSSFVEDTESQSQTVTGDLILNSNFNLTDDIGLRAIFGASTKAYDYRYSSIRANNLSIPGFYDISNGTGQLDGTVDEEQRREFGVFADLEFNFRQWFYLNLSGRQDYTSTLAPDDRSYFYPAGGISVILSEAIPTLQNSTVLSLLKVTANNSTVYNDLDPYEINERYFQSGAFPFGSVNGFYLGSTTVDAQIQKEKLNTTEFGLNSAFYQGRITFDAAYFTTKTTNLITSTKPSLGSAATSFLTNIGELSSNGIELSLGSRILSIGDLFWDVKMSYTQYDQKVVSIKEGITEIPLDVYAAGFGTYAIVDETFPQIKAVGYKRDPQGRIIIDPVSGNPIVGDLQNLGKTTPDYILGLYTQVGFKGITVSATFDYRTGHVYYAQGQDIMEFTGRSLESVSANREDFVWPNSVIETSEGVFVENTNIPITGGKMAFWKDHYNQIKENYLKDASALKMRELAVNYKIPPRVLANTGFISSLSIGFVGRNLLTVLPGGQTKFSDPEFKNTRGTDDPNGIGIGGYLSPPPVRSYGFTVNVEF